MYICNVGPWEDRFINSQCLYQKWLKSLSDNFPQTLAPLLPLSFATVDSSDL